MKLAVCFLAALGLLATSMPAQAHWCSNIFGAHARLIIKPEKTTVNLTGSSVKLKVYMQNNFPYKLTNVRMQGTASGYTISVAPSSQTVYPGQQVLFTYTIAGGSGTVQVSKLNLAVRIRQGGWQGETGKFVNPNPSSSNLISASSYGSSLGQQTPSLNAATLADLYPSSKITKLVGRTGVQQLINWFGYRFCYNSSGGYRCGSQNCPSPCAEGSTWTATNQFPQNCMRAGIDLGIRKAKLGSQLASARNGAINAMKAGSSEHKCLAAVVGGHLWTGASSTTSFESGLNSLSSACKAAGLRAVGKGNASSCGSGQFYEKAACAGAEGLRGNDGPVKSVLMPNSGDGSSCGSYTCLYYAYMLYLVTGDRLAQGKVPSYYPNVGPPPAKLDKGVTPTTDQGVGPLPDQGPPPQLDGFIPGSDSVKPGLDGSPPDGPRGEDGCTCRVGTAGQTAPLFLFALGLVLGLALVRRRS